MIVIAWSAPMTAVANAAFTAAQFNTYVRDTLNETAPAKATNTAKPTVFVGNGTNSIAQRVIDQTTISTSETTTSTSYADLTAGTPGPAITITTGAWALVSVSAQITHSAADVWSTASWETAAIPASDTQAVVDHVSAVNAPSRSSAVTLATGLTPGSNTFTMKYRTLSGTATFASRRILVMAL